MSFQVEWVKKTRSFTVDLPGVTARKSMWMKPTGQYLGPMSALNFFGTYPLVMSTVYQLENGNRNIEFSHGKC